MRATSAVHPVPSVEQEGWAHKVQVECRLGFEGRDPGSRGDEHQLDFTATEKCTRCVVQGSCRGPRERRYSI